MKRSHEEAGDDGRYPVEVTGPVGGVTLYNTRLWAALPSAMPSNEHPWLPPDISPSCEGTQHYDTDYYSVVAVWVDAAPPPEMCLIDTSDCNDVSRMEVLINLIIGTNYDDKQLDLCVCSADGERALVFALAVLRARIQRYVPSTSIVPEVSGALKCESKLSTSALVLLGNLDRVYYTHDYSE
jgi:hypothetical protein